MKDKLKVVKNKSNDYLIFYRLKISLDESKPEIWRQITVPGKISTNFLNQFRNGNRKEDD
jgi:hypothetical protein